MKCKNCVIYKEAERIFDDWMLPDEDWRRCEKVWEDMGAVEGDMDMCDEFFDCAGEE